jgi:hypothetical protein
MSLKGKFSTLEKDVGFVSEFHFASLTSNYFLRLPTLFCDDSLLSAMLPLSPSPTFAIVLLHNKMKKRERHT